MTDQSNAHRTTAYELIGGAESIRQLVDRFYDLMELEPAYAVIRQLHPADLSTSRDKLYLFLSGWMGGPGFTKKSMGTPCCEHVTCPFRLDQPSATNG
jgi:hemoglobin